MLTAINNRIILKAALSDFCEGTASKLTNKAPGDRF